MILYDGKTKLAHARQQLWARWDDAQARWDDAVSRDFERDYLEPLGPKTAATLSAIDRLAEVLGRAQLECRCS